MKSKYEALRMEMIFVESTDVITTSDPSTGFYGDEHKLTPFS